MTQPTYKLFLVVRTARCFSVAICPNQNGEWMGWREWHEDCLHPPHPIGGNHQVLQDQSVRVYYVEAHYNLKGRLVGKVQETTDLLSSCLMFSMKGIGFSFRIIITKRPT